MTDVTEAVRGMPETGRAAAATREAVHRYLPASTTASPGPSSGMLTAPAATPNRPPSTVVELVADLAVGPRWVACAGAAPEVSMATAPMSGVDHVDDE
ncbi:MAG TPA: hypothetical protein VF003_20460 [Pseudonocardiaceae bacterium]